MLAQYAKRQMSRPECGSGALAAPTSGLRGGSGRTAGQQAHCVRLKVQTHASGKATAENAKILLRSANREPSGDNQIAQSSRARPYTRQRDCGAVSGEGGSRQACTGYGVVDKVEGVAGGP